MAAGSKFSRKQRLVLAGVVVVLSLFGATLLIRLTMPKKAPPIAAVADEAPAPPAKNALPDDEHVFVAVALPEQAVDLVASTVGVVGSIEQQLGASARAGEPVVRIKAEDVGRDSSEANAIARQAEAEVLRAQAQLQDAKQRLVSRSGEGVVSVDERQSAQIAVRVATANLEVARQRYNQSNAAHAKARFRADQLLVKAPFDGVVAARYVTEGAPVTAGTRLVRFIGLRRPLVRSAVPNQQATRIKVGDRCTFHPDGSPATDPVNIVRIAPEADPNSGLVVIEAAFADGSTDLRPGTVGKLDLNGEAAKVAN